MSRRNSSDKDLLILGLLILAGIAILAGLAIYKTSLFIIAVLILLLFCGVGFGIVNFFKKLGVGHERRERHANMAGTRTTIQMEFLSPTQFEHYVGTIYEKLKYQVTVTKQSGDGGIDLILENDQGTYGVQVKRYKDTRVGRPEIQKLVGAGLHKYDKLIFITTSLFTQEAIEYSKEMGIELVDGQELAKKAELVFGKNYMDQAYWYKFEGVVAPNTSPVYVSKNEKHPNPYSVPWKEN